MTEDNVMKIADFGLARGVHQIDYYKKTTNVSDARSSGLSGITFDSCNFPVEKLNYCSPFTFPQWRSLDVVISETRASVNLLGSN